jgi:hypothetical protein
MWTTGEVKGFKKNMSSYRVEMKVVEIKGYFPMRSEEVVLGAEHLADDLSGCIDHAQDILKVWNNYEESENSNPGAQVFTPYTAEEIASFGSGEMIHRLGERFPILCVAHGRWSDAELRIALMTVTQDWPMPHPQLVKDNPQA